MTALILELTDQQVMQLFSQLSAEQKERLLRYLTAERWPSWVATSQAGSAGVQQAAAQRGLNWEAMTESEREDWVDALVHESRQ